MNKKKYRKGFSSISEILSPLAKKTIGQQGFIEIEILLNWEDIVGKNLADFSLPQKTVFNRGEKNNGKLYIQVPSGAFALEIQHKERLIIDKINTYFGYNAISGLSIIQNLKMNLTKINKDIQQVKKTLVTKEEENYIETITNELKNENLRKILTKLGISIFSDENLKQQNKEE